MDMKNGRYLKYEICAFSGDKNNMWLVVWDGQYNYMVFNSVTKAVLKLYQRGRLPFNGVGRANQVVYYSKLNKAMDYLVKCVAGDDKI